ncbi:MAG: MFS transporter [Acidimicrobiales bacterium]
MAHAVEPARPPDTADGAPAGDRRRWGVLAVLCLSVFLIVVDNTIVNVALPTLVRDLGATTSQLQWIVDAYTLVFAGLLLAGGSVGDRWGRKGALLVGLVLFAGFSALAAMSSTPGQLIAARGAMGVGAALIFPATLALLVNVFTDARERAKAIGIWAAVSGLSVALGPVAGGWLLEHFWWGSVFLVNLPVVVVAVVAVALVVPTSRDTSVGRFDPLGLVLSITGVTLLVWAVIEGPHHGWTSTTSLLVFTTSAVLLGSFVAWELRRDDPMLDVRVFRSPRFTAGSLAVTFAFFALFGFIFMVTQYFQFVRGYGTLEAGLRTVPFALFTGATAPIAPRLAERFGTKLVVASGLVSMAAGFFVAGRLGPDASYWAVVGAMLLMGAGLGLVNAPATEAIMGSLPPAKAGVGSAVNDTTRELGGTLGVAIVGSVFASVYGGRLADALVGQPIPEAAAGAARESIGAAYAVAAQAPPPFAEALRSVARTAFMDGFSAGSTIAAGVVLVGAALALAFLPARAVDAAVGPVDLDEAADDLDVGDAIAGSGPFGGSVPAPVPEAAG